MTWVRVDTAFPHHLKILSVGPLGAWVYLRGLCYAGEARTDGFIPQAILPELLAGLEVYAVTIDSRAKGQLRRTQRAPSIDWPTRLIAARLWEPVEGGWMIHNYTRRNPTKAYMDDLSATRSTVGKRGAEARWKDGKPHGKLPVSTWQTDGKGDGTIRDDTEKPLFFSGPTETERPAEPGPEAASNGHHLTPEQVKGDVRQLIDQVLRPRA